MTELDDAAISDAILIARAKAGETNAFGFLYRRYVLLIYRYVRSRVRCDADAEDQVEQVFLKAFQRIAQYEERGVPYSAYLYRIARHGLVDYYRRKEPLQSLETVEIAHTELEDVETRLTRRDDLRKTKVALQALPEQYQEVIRLRLLLDLSTEEVAQLLEKRQGTVRVLFHRAMKKLRELMDQDENEE